MTELIKTSINTDTVIELSTDDEFREIKDAVASTVSDNPTISWAKFILTDDMPNENKMRVPQEEFSNLIRSGTYMPFKMAYERPKNGHEESHPLGVIAQLKQSGNQVIALAALWIREREQDIDYIKACIKDKIPVNVSWEILHDTSTIDEAGIENLVGTSLRGVTIVGRPAYAGRTPVLEVASVEGSETNSEEITVEELEELKAKVTELETTLATKDADITARDAEITSLKEFKASVEEKEAALEKFQEVKDLFKTSGITKPDEYFDTNKEKLVGMKKEDLEFMLQEMVAFSSTHEEHSSTEENSTEIPDVPGTLPKELDIKELAKELRKNSK